MKLPIVQRTCRRTLQGSFFARFALVSITSAKTFDVNRCPRTMTIVLFCAIKRVLRGETIRHTSRGVDHLLSIHPRHASMFHRNGCVGISPGRMQANRQVRMGPNKHVPLSKVLRRARTSFSASTLANRDVPHVLQGKSRILTKVVMLKRAIHVRIGHPCRRDTLTHVLILIGSTTRHGTPTRLFVHQFTQFCAPTIVILTLLVIAIPTFTKLVVPSFRCIFRS